MSKNIKVKPPKTPFGGVVDNNQDSLDYVKASSIVPTSVKWLWNERIALGKITVFAGEGGTGKSQLLIYLSSLITTGSIFPPDKSKFPKGKVIILSAEDAENDTLVPRLMAAGADLDSIIFLRGTKSLDAEGKEQYSAISFDHDLEKIGKVIEEVGDVIAVIVDPISAYLGEINDNSNAEVRHLLAKLSKIAEYYNTAFILNSHLSKPNSNGKASAANRVLGSSAWVNAARACYLICKDSEDPNRRKFTPIKNNLGNDTTGFVYKIKSAIIKTEHEDIKTSHVEFFNEVITELSNDLVNDFNKEKSLPIKDAKDFLLSFLAMGSKPLEEIQKEAAIMGISKTTLYRAKDELGIADQASVTRYRGKIWFLTAQ